jgi:light-regulated signal transduction histidine kinase (bacteriophytochrome)
MTDPRLPSSAPGPLDLTSCDLEPVHLIGTVQSHGALLIFEAQSGALREASTNWPSFLPPTEAKARHLNDIFPSPIVESLNEIETSDRAVVLNQTLCEAAEISAHRIKDHLIVELESTKAAIDFDSVSGLNTIMRGISRAANSTDYLASLASELRKGIGIDRVLVYRFLPDWTGEVVAEACFGQTRYLGLRFPSTDIPKPARQIFEKVWVRHIADVSSEAVAVQGPAGGLTAVDLTQVGIRAASPIHLEYLKNMDVQASLTLSLRIDGKLWGLVACHHKTAFLLRPSARASLEILAQMASFQLSGLFGQETKELREQFEIRLARLEGQLEFIEDLRLASQLDELNGLIDSHLVAIFENRRWTRRAGVHLDVLDAFERWLRAQSSDHSKIFHRTNLPEGLVPGYAGVLVVAPSGMRGKWICWFRQEQAQSVRWAGHPEKAASPQTGRLHPRASFAEYVEITRGQSLPWTDLDLWKANRLAQTLTSLSLRMHRRLELKNEALARSNKELDSFAYMAAHDLQEPLRGIHNYATFLKEDYADKLDGDGIVFLDGLTELVTRMSTLVDSLLAYSRLDSQRLEVRDCDLTAMARDTCRLLKLTRQAEVEILEPLPVVQAYPPFLAEILVNLLSNAVKYSDAADRQVEIGALPSDESSYDTFYVKDNGLGIAAEFHSEIFNLFRRLHGEGERGDGAGVGLTIVLKMVERHNGKVWVESAPGEGSTFFVSLPALTVV